ncbi:MAG: hypothetical protein WC376_04610 [Candidatus Nanoarchaeia archaeon]|jgi:hypothetical protein
MEDLTKSLILGTLFLIGILFIISLIFFARTNAINNFFCQQTGSIRSMFSNYLGDFMAGLINDVFDNDVFNTVPLICSQNVIEIDASKEDADMVIANEIISCWEKFGAGTQDAIYPAINFLCSTITYNSTNPKNYVDLMRVYSIVYNRTDMQNYETFNTDKRYPLDKANPFKFCLEDNYNLFLTQEILTRGIILGEFKNGSLIGNNTRHQLSGESNINIFSSAMLSYPTCLSLKEGAINLFRLNYSIYNYDSDSISSLFLSLNLITAIKMQNKLPDEIIGQRVMPIPIDSSAEFNQSSKIYQGTFYVKFFDYAYWWHNKQNNDFFLFSEMNDMLFPANFIQRITIPNENEHDYIALGYSPELKEVVI